MVKRGGIAKETEMVEIEGKEYCGGELAHRKRVALLAVRQPTRAIIVLRSLEPSSSRTPHGYAGQDWICVPQCIRSSL